MASIPYVQDKTKRTCRAGAFRFGARGNSGMEPARAFPVGSSVLDAPANVPYNGRKRREHAGAGLLSGGTAAWGVHASKAGFMGHLS